MRFVFTSIYSLRVPQNEFSVSDFTLDKPHCIKDGEYQGELVGQIKFKLGAK